MNSKTLEEIRSLLSGPVNSIATPFTESKAIDWDGVSNIIEHGIAGGSSISLLTYGDSQIEFLSDDELEQMTRFTAKQSAGRSLVVAASRAGSTAQIVDFAHFCKSVGADVLMLYIGLYTRNANGASLAEFFGSVAQVLPVMLVNKVDDKVLNILRDEPRIVAYKEDDTTEYAVKTMRHYPHWRYLSGGGLWRNYAQWPCGCHAFMSPWCVLQPEVNQLYYKAMQSGDLNAACEVITKYDWSLFDGATAVSGGWQPAWHAMLEAKGIAQRYLREPMLSANEADVETMRELLRKLDVAL